MRTISPARCRNVIVLVVATMAAWLVPASAAEAQTVNDAIRRYAPLVFLHSDDNDDPMGALFFISGSNLRWSHDGCDDHPIPNADPIDPAKLRPRTDPGYSHLAGCDHDLGLYHAGEFTRPRDDANPFGSGEAEGFFMDLDNDLRTGVGTSAPVYFEFRRNPRSITYWFLYGFNQGPIPGGVDNHEGDWERISVQLNANNRAVAVAYHQHRGACRLAWPDVPKARNGHPIAFSANGSHANYPWPGTYINIHPIGNWEDKTDRGPRWRTWERFANVRLQPWYGFGGAWGEVGNRGESTGVAGPSRYRLGPPSNFDTLKACERPV